MKKAGLINVSYWVTKEEKEKLTLLHKKLKLQRELSELNKATDEE